MGSLDQRFFPEIGAGGFSRIDGTVAFYQRVNSLLKKSDVLLDYGAGRGAAYMDDNCKYRRDLCNFRTKVSKVIGVDVDEVVLKNPALDEAYVFVAGESLSLADKSIDIVVSDFVFEHISDPAQAAKELDRVLKPGGWLCARTPNRNGYIALGNRLVPETIKMRILGRLQPERKEQDVFPALYRMNTFRSLLKYFPAERFEHFSYTWDPEPAYHANSRFFYSIWRAIQGITPAPFRAMLMVFFQKRV